MPNRVPLVQISSRSWEHPADRAALNTLRAIPGFDEVVRKVAGFFGERGIRQLFLGDAVKVSAGQRPKMNAMWTEVLETLDWPERPELYVSQTPIANAMAVGFDKPFVVMHSGLLEILDEEEQRAILGHELGHIMSGHPTYTTIAIILMYFGVSHLPFLAGRARAYSLQCIAVDILQMAALLLFAWASLAPGTGVLAIATLMTVALLMQAWYFRVRAQQALAVTNA